MFHETTFLHRDECGDQHPFKNESARTIAKALAPSGRTTAKTPDPLEVPCPIALLIVLMILVCLANSFIPMEAFFPEE